MKSLAKFPTLEGHGKFELELRAIHLEKDNMDRKIIIELYHSLALLGAKMDLLGTVGSWKDSMSDEDTLSSLKAWNKATFEELRKVVKHYEIVDFG